MPEKIPYQNPADAVPAEVAGLVHAGRRLEVVGRYRALTGASHEEAREVVSRL